MRKPKVWARIKLKISSGNVDVFVITPPCNTHSRVWFANSHGPAPVRSKVWPRGFPWLRGKAKEECERANFFVDITEEGCRLAAQHKAFYLVEHPEDLPRPDNHNRGPCVNLGLRGLSVSGTKQRRQDICPIPMPLPGTNF